MKWLHLIALIALMLCISWAVDEPDQRRFARDNLERKVVFRVQARYYSTGWFSVKTLPEPNANWRIFGYDTSGYDTTGVVRWTIQSGVRFEEVNNYLYIDSPSLLKAK